MKSTNGVSLTKGGFTLIELVIVIGMISMMAAMAVPSMSGVTNRTKDVKLVCDLQTLDTMILTYYGEHDCYPELISDLSPTYLKKVPTDVKKNDLSYTLAEDKESYVLSGKNSKEVDVVSPGSSS